MKPATELLQESARLFLGEAETCASLPVVQGFAAMSTALCCVLAFGEILVKHKDPTQTRVSDWDSILAFAQEMTSTDWFAVNGEALDRDTPANLIYDVRNGFVHALSIPDGVGMIPTMEDVQAAFAKGCRVVIVPMLFVLEVKAAIARIFEKYPALDASPLHENLQRSPVVLHRATSTGSAPPL